MHARVLQVVLDTLRDEQDQGRGAVLVQVHAGRMSDIRRRDRDPEAGEPSMLRTVRLNRPLYLYILTHYCTQI